MFKKFIIAMLLIVSFIGATLQESADAYTTTNEKIEYTDTIKIENASYSEVDGVFYVYTVKDQTGGFWVMDFKPLKGETLEQFKKRVIGHYLIVKYLDDVQTEDETEITGKYIL